MLTRRRKRRKLTKSAKPKCSYRRRLNRRKRGWIRRPVKPVPTGKFNLSVRTFGLPLGIRPSGQALPGTVDTAPDTLSQRERARHIKYARAFVSGIVTMRLTEKERKHLKGAVYRYGQGQFMAKPELLARSDYVRYIVSAAIRSPSRFVTIYGASYKQLIRAPTFEFNSRMGPAYAISMMVMSGSTVASLTSKGTKVRGALTSLRENSLKLSLRLGIADPGVSRVTPLKAAI